MGFSATAQGIARAMLEAFKELALDKTPRMARSKMKDNPVIQSDMAHCEARLRGARAYLFEEIEDIWDEVQRTGELSIANRMRIRLVATHGIHEAKAVAETVYDLAGVSAIRAESPFQRRYRDIRSVTQQLQGRRSHFQTVGAYLFGHPADLGVA
jgi:alkylation response protein AidB-like acyl-CoA dehydrogenase